MNINVNYNGQVIILNYMQQQGSNLFYGSLRKTVSRKYNEDIKFLIGNYSKYLDKSKGLILKAFINIFLILKKRMTQQQDFFYTQSIQLYFIDENETLLIIYQSLIKRRDLILQTNYIQCFKIQGLQQKSQRNKVLKRIKIQNLILYLQEGELNFLIWEKLLILLILKQKSQ
ncbi:hypothetical protein pb186bvf_019067 [Paramecium bursaria]